MNTKTAELFEGLTARIVKVIEAGEAGKWNKPWTAMFAASGMPHNATTQKPYHGFNVLILWASALENGYETQEWATYKQWQEKGAQVRKGEHGEKLVKWGFTFKCSNGHKGQRPCSCDPSTQEKFAWASPFTVFNAAQVDGYTPETVEVPGGFDALAEADAFIEATGAAIVHRAGDRAYYTPGTDTITLPLREQFETPQGYYGTALHELTHWTGAEHRLSREKGLVFGDDRYAREELVAELGATFLAAHLGVEVEPHDEHAAYLASWLRNLKGDAMYLYRAARDASKASEFLIETVEANQAASEAA